jgi:hypothetical protein
MIVTMSTASGMSGRRPSLAPTRGRDALEANSKPEMYDHGTIAAISNATKRTGNESRATVHATCVLAVTSRRKLGKDMRATRVFSPTTTGVRLNPLSPRLPPLTVRSAGPTCHERSELLDHADAASCVAGASNKTRPVRARPARSVANGQCQD